MGNNNSIVPLMISDVIRLNKEESSIFHTVMDLFYSSICMKSTLKRSITLTLQELTCQFPEYLQSDVIAVIKKMEANHILIQKYENQGLIQYCLNPNKVSESIEISKNIDKEVEEVYEPIEERLRGYKRIFSTEAPNFIQGKKSTYDYYQRANKLESLTSEFCVVITGKDNNSRIIKLGNINDPSSLGGSISSLVTKMPSTFTKVELENKLPRHVLKNRQPLKAVLDILVYLNIIELTGRKINRSQEFRKLNNLTVITLDKIFDEIEDAETSKNSSDSQSEKQ